MCVVVVERVRQGSVYEGDARRRIPSAPADNAGLPLAAPGVDHPGDHPGGLRVVRRERDADDVRDPAPCVPQDALFYPASPGFGGEPGDLPQ